MAACVAGAARTRTSRFEPGSVEGTSCAPRRARSRTCGGCRATRGRSRDTTSRARRTTLHGWPPSGSASSRTSSATDPWTPTSTCPFPCSAARTCSASPSCTSCTASERSTAMVDCSRRGSSRSGQARRKTCASMAGAASASGVAVMPPGSTSPTWLLWASPWPGQTVSCSLTRRSREMSETSRILLVWSPAERTRPRLAPSALRATVLAGVTRTAPGSSASASRTRPPSG
mmetsp:Transcript_48667/g.145381  ORF Transcript_48667/g.145381 Transcript_48667/m.145381 type:complete len:231 (-) Transcript_48667:419-1111(-)